MRPIWIAVTVAAIGLAGGTPLAAGTKATAAEIKTAFVGKSVNTTSPRGSSCKTTYKPDGRTSGVCSGRTDAGKWRIKGDLFCSKWNKWGGGVEKCYEVFIDGNSVKLVNTANGQSTDGTISGS